MCNLQIDGGREKGGRAGGGERKGGGGVNVIGKGIGPYDLGLNAP